MPITATRHTRSHPIEPSMLARFLRPRETEVQMELFRLGHRNLAVHLLGQITLPLIVAAGTWGTAGRESILVWLALMALSAMALAAAWWRFRKPASAGATLATLKAWQRTHMLVLCLAGLAWGAEGMLLVPGTAGHNLLIMTAFAGTMAYSAASNPAYDLPAFGVSMTLGTGLMAWHLPPVFPDHGPFIAAMCGLYLLVLGVVAKNAHDTVLTSVRLRLENQELATRYAQQAERADRANRGKSEFLAAASHDLRQPVHALLLLLEAYRTKIGEAGQDPLLARIAMAAESISTLFNALMELSRLQGGQEQPRLADVPLAALVERCAARFRPDAEHHGLRYRWRVQRGLETAWVRTDPVLLERVVGNLLSNAVRYTHRGGVLLALRKGNGGALRLEVWDTGQGIAAAERERIFEPYYQIGNPERDRTKGLGLGLAIVRQAVELLDIPLTVASTPGRGSRFTLMLAHWWSAPDLGLPPRDLQVTPGLAGMRILLVDDDPLVRDAMEALLTNWGADLRIGNRGDDSVLNICNDGWQPHCILCDYRLPGNLTGLDLLDMLQEHHPGAAGILITGELADRVQAEAEERGYLLLPKPVESGLLGATLSALNHGTKNTLQP